MPGPLLPEDLQGRLDLHQRRHQVGLDRRLVGPELAGAQRSALADTGVDDDAIQTTELTGQIGEHLRHLLVIVDVELGNRDRDIRIALREFGFQLLQPVDAASAQRQIPALGGERPGHPGTQPGACAGDENPLPGHFSSLDILRSASTLPPVWHPGQY